MLNFKKLFGTSAFCLCFSMTAVANDHRGFIDYCRNLNDLGDDDLKRTVRILLRASANTDCDKALAKLQSYTNIALTNEKMINVEPFTGMTWLKGLEISRSQIVDSKPFGTITSLEKLRVYDNKIESLDFISTLPNLQELKIERNRVQNLAAVARHPTLKELNISLNPDISDVSPLGQAQLTKLWMNSVVISDKLDRILPQPELTLAELSLTQLDDLSAFAAPGAAPKIKRIFLRKNNITEISSIAGLTTLEGLDLAHNPIADLKPLEGLQLLTGLDVSYVAARNLAEVLPKLKVTQLKAAGLEIEALDWMASLPENTFILDLSDNKISDVAPLYRFKNLTELNLSQNPIQTVDMNWLRELNKLKVFEIDLRTISDPALRRELLDFKMHVFERHRISGSK